jgi:Sulfotransferase domain
MKMRSSIHRGSAGRLPNLLIVGVPKAGTGSLFSYLAQHPEICPSTEKEVGFFSPLSENGGALPATAAYEAYFRHCEMQPYAMEATPSYCYGGRRLVAGVKETLERPRILMILRDPVDRLWSAYTFQRSLMHLPGIESFEAYVAACQDQRRQSFRERRSIPASGYLKGLAIGFYAEYLGDWLATFSDDARIVFFDDLASGPQDLLSDLCHWLGIDVSPIGAFDYTVRNPTVPPRSMTTAKTVFAAKRRFGPALARSPRLRSFLGRAYLKLNRGSLSETMRPSTRAQLAELYRESNLAVADQLAARGYELPNWLAQA